MKDTPAPANVRIVPMSFERALKVLRRMLVDAGLRIAAEIDLSGALANKIRPGSGIGSILLVDSPLLLLESVALDRAAAVFVPYHIVVCGNHESTCVCWPDLGKAIGTRLPATAVHAMTRLRNRINFALDSRKFGVN